MLQALMSVECQWTHPKPGPEMPSNGSNINSCNIGKHGFGESFIPIIAHVSHQPLNPIRQNVRVTVRAAALAPAQTGRNSFFPAPIESYILEQGRTGATGRQTVDAG